MHPVLASASTGKVVPGGAGAGKGHCGGGEWCFLAGRHESGWVREEGRISGSSACHIQAQLELPSWEETAGACEVRGLMWIRYA